jgi:hypothetical protein
MTNKILISDIKIDREIPSDLQLDDLDRNDLKQPIVLQGTLLVDGLRRIEKAKQLGITELPFVDPQTIEELAEALAKAHPTPVKNWLRVYQLMKHLNRQIAKRGKRYRATHMTRINKERFGHEAPEELKIETARELVKRALGGIPSAQSESIVRVIEGAPKHIVLAILNGEVTPAGALMRWNRTKRFQGRVTGEAEQETFIREATQTIRAATDSLWMLGDINIKADRFETLLKGLKLARRGLATMINQLEEAEGK